MTEAAPIVAAGAVVASGSVLRPGWVQVTGDRISGVGAGEPPADPDVSWPHSALVPGFVDMHVHGGGGFSFDHGSQDEARGAVQWHRAQGTTSMLASLVSAPGGELRRRVAVLADLVQEGLLSGIHLEGPWLAPGKRGAHRLQALRDPRPQEVEELLRAGRGTIRMVTLAPERPGGQDAVRQLVEAGVVVAIGHTEADEEQTRRAVAAGATVATHLFNAMPAVHHRDPGPVPVLLGDPRVTVELIADGLHLHPAIVEWVVRTAGPARVAFVTDAMAAAGMPDGAYTLGTLPVQVRQGVARLPDGSIAGSTATTPHGFAAARETATDADAGLALAGRVCATTPARALGLHDVGLIEVGRRADLVMLGDATPQAVMSRGVWLPRAERPGASGAPQPT
ncbi:MAG TPA: N-acetylglucosamine-6-phosphate deacetylase [Ornithinimicrobium sp.]|uniref:N-acetylglucosamine-6-phosphate deacetylase n=1 Tax=Ornithinimicrobium sp. TaxID=1977084 RepID=UPI002B46DDEF|nr:N-acetylglucosamine-6-phosphate deacetylase [Ornithinimicrobium sp.]HKJ12247.1 N-acetylglucosamine-6-phosphate deacetylase [Ornithinimicrobium sp.]